MRGRGVQALATPMLRRHSRSTEKTRHGPNCEVVYGEEHAGRNDRKEGAAKTARF